MVCEGVWLDLIPNTTKWYKLTQSWCLVRMQVVVDADLGILPFSEENGFRSNVGRNAIEHAKANGAWRIQNEDHSFMMGQATQRAVFEFETIFDKSHFDEDDAGDDEDMDWDNFEEDYEGEEGNADNKPLD